MFHLTRTYSIASLLGIAIVAFVLSVFYREFAVAALIEQETQANVALTRALANTLWPKYAAFVRRAGAIPAAQLPRRPEIAQLNEDVRRKIAGLHVVKIKLYNLDGLTVYSSEASQIGANNAANTGFQTAKAGGVESELVFRDRFSLFEQVIENRDLLSSYIPIRRRTDDPVEGVFEVYSDVTPLPARPGGPAASTLRALRRSSAVARTRAPRSVVASTIRNPSAARLAAVEMLAWMPATARAAPYTSTQRSR